MRCDLSASGPLPRRRRSRARSWCTVVALVGLLAGPWRPAHAQGAGFRPTAQWEGLAALAVSGSAAAEAGFGVNVPAGFYARIAAVAVAGAPLGGSGPRVVRTEVVGRFLADPFREGRWGPYAGGGVAAVWRDGERVRPTMVFVVGTDFPLRQRWTPAVEAAVGGGVRVSLVFRRARTAGR